MPEPAAAFDAPEGQVVPAGVFDQDRGLKIWPGELGLPGELREAVLHRPLVQVLGFRQQIDAQAKGLQ